MRTVGKVGLAAILLVAWACGGSGGPPPAQQWKLAHEQPDAALLTVWAGDDHVYAAGADTGAGSTVVRRATDAWERIDTGTTGTVWWMAEDRDGALWMAGEDGLMMQHVPGTDTFERDTAMPTRATLFGVWFAPDGTGFAVGGDVDAESARGALLVREPGTDWHVDVRAPTALVSGHTLFKVWGTASNDVWVVGEDGLVLRFDGSQWSQVETDVGARLFTVHGSAETGPYAVGGGSNGVILEWDGEGFASQGPELVGAFNGVCVESRRLAYAVGNRGLVATRTGRGWSLVDEPGTRRDLHAVTVDGRGVAWAVGGALTSTLDSGVVVRGEP